MRGKAARHFRKILSFHPNDERNYELIQKSRSPEINGKVYIYGMVRCTDKPRIRYKIYKKHYHSMKAELKQKGAL